MALTAGYERRQPGQRAADKERLRVQLDRLRNKQRAHQFQRELFGTIDERQRRRRDRLPLGRIDREQGDFLVALSGEILVRTGDGSDTARELLGRAYEEYRVRDLDGKVTRFAKPRATLDETRASVAGLREAGVQATVNYVLPLGYIAKGEGGFENTTVALDTFEGGTAGQAVRVAVIDTGVAGKRRADGWLSGVPRGLGSVDPLYQDGQHHLLDFAAGHGTFVAGVVQQVAPAADIRSLAAVQSNGIGSELAVAGALLRAARAGAQVINMSLGSETENEEEPVGLAVALEIIAAELGDSAPVVVAAAGNAASDKKTWPAAFEGVLGVASLAADGNPSAWSDRGAWVGCSAIGEGIVSTYVEGQEDEAVDKEDPDTFEVDAWALGTGTSFAAPQISGRLAAVLAEEPTLTPQQAIDAVLAGGRDLSAQGFGTAVSVLPGT
jgi:subtilisin family serine protease